MYETLDQKKKENNWQQIALYSNGALVLRL